MPKLRLEEETAFLKNYKKLSLYSSLHLESMQDQNSGCIQFPVWKSKILKKGVQFSESACFMDYRCCAGRGQPDSRHGPAPYRGYDALVAPDVLRPGNNVLVIL